MTYGDNTHDLARLRQRREANRTKELAELLDRRPDLRGVHQPADLAAEYVLWTA